jgi:hypothetical protein
MTEAAIEFHRKLHELITHALSKDGTGLEVVLEHIAAVCEENAERVKGELPSNPEFITGWKITAKRIRDSKSTLTYNCPYP